MATGFGFCPTCGTPRAAAEQKFCPTCGSALAAAPAAFAVPPVAGPVAPDAPPAWSPPPAVEPTAQAPWTAPPAVSGGAAPLAAPFAPATTGAGNKSRPVLLIVGGIVLVLIIGLVYVNMSSSKPGGISVTPSTISCSSTASYMVTIRLPSSVHAGDVITDQLDGHIQATDTVNAAFIQQSDGSWLLTSPGSTSTVCGSGISMGTHDEKFLDASGHVLAEGTYTVTP